MDATHAGLFARVVQSAAEDEGKFETREASMFPENPVNVTHDWVDSTHAGLFARVVQSAVGAEGKCVTREASICPEKQVSVTDDCADATHVGLFASVFQSGVGGEGNSLILEAGRVPENCSRYNELCVGAAFPLIQPAICPLLADLSRSSLKLPVNNYWSKIIDSGTKFILAQRTS
jgi:hypothetical protein